MHVLTRPEDTTRSAILAAVPRLQEEVHRAQADGEVTSEERLDVTKDLVHASHQIFRLTGTQGRSVLITGA